MASYGQMDIDEADREAAEAMRAAEEMMAKAAAMRAEAAARKEAAAAAAVAASAMPPTQEPPPRLDINNVEFALDQLKEEATKDEFRIALETMRKYVDGVQKMPGDPRPRAIRFMNKAFQERVGRFRAGLLFMEALGFQLHMPDDHMYLRAEDARFTEDVLKRLDIRLVEFKPAEKENKLAPAIYAGRNSMPTPSSVPRPVSASTETLMDRKVAKLKSLKSDALKEDPRFNRDVKLFLPNDPEGEERIRLEEADFEMSGEDFKRMQPKRAKEATLKTQAMRDYERLKAMKVYKKAVMRVRLPNQCILQASFHPQERVSTLMSCVQGCLSVPATFGLWGGHPLKQVAAEVLQQSFVEAGLSPYTVLHLRWSGAPPGSEFLKSEVTATLKEEVEAPPSAMPVDEGMGQGGGNAPAGAGSAKPGAKSGTSKDEAARKAVEDRMKKFMCAK